MKWRLVALLIALTAVGMCMRDRLAERPREAPPPVVGPAAPGLGEAEAREALAVDAWRRHRRFLEAVDPGRTLRETRAADARVHDPAALARFGALLFAHRFGRHEGFGGRDTPLLARVHRGARGGPDAYACAACHRRGGIAGAGDASDNAFLDGDGDRPGAAIVRNPIALVGAGVVELLAREMTADLQRLRDEAIEASEARIALVSKGVSFGELVVRDGKVDTSGVRGVDHDLVVRPFGWNGHTADLRTMIEDELALHHGMQSSHFAATAPAERAGPFGGDDPDGDGVPHELTEDQITALTLFVAMQEIPVMDHPADPRIAMQWAEGQAGFAEVGCAGCHRPALPLRSTIYELPARDGPPITVDLAEHGLAPRLSRSADGYVVHLFSDLKRHIVGPYLRDDRSYRGISPAQFRTPPLWGLARSRPYLHDGRAPTLEQAIFEHEGEATESRLAYEQLDEHARAAIRIYLTSLTRAPRFE